MSISLERKGILKDGNYRFRVKNAEVKDGPNSKYIAVEMEVLDNNGKPTDRLLWDNVSLSPRSAWMLDQFMDTLSLDDTGNMSYKQFCRHIIGKQGICVVGHRVFKGQNRNDVEGYVSPQAAETMELSEAPVYDPGSYTPDDDDDEGDEPKAFRPSNPLEDEGEEEVPDALENVTEGTDEDIPF